MLLIKQVLAGCEFIFPAFDHMNPLNPLNQRGI
jgi:hypothetical protein